ncbi:hypothetical protein TL16_g10949 [Triparma laevis f. inornata]|uniref:Mitochondrial carrier protein n=1 Tax=Triparma laevis f. inornata TaxID=1714386 RepID=A0A9W7BB63_9STRA|nr:hypothetical protein TL16_g10949 [Triparma laevis f. inornata]
MNLAAGALAGSSGVFVSFPFDTLKTLSQVRSTENLPSLVKQVLREDGVAGFYGGVKGMVVGQAFIKAVAFASNDWALQYTSQLSSSNFIGLVSAAMFAGFVTSFLVTPIERVKIILQAKRSGDKKQNELNVIRNMLSEPGGVKNLFTVGLSPTISREVPSYALYFVTYKLLIDSHIFLPITGPTFAPLLAGAMAGIACWVPVYPIDVVKTTMQESSANQKKSAISIFQTILREEGISGLFDGLTPKVVRAAVNHAVTFFVYSYLTTSGCL